MTIRFAGHSVASTLLRAGAVIASVAMLAGCGNATSNSGGQTTDASSSSTGYPVTITSVYGKTEIKAQPKRVATVGWATYDALLAMDVVPVTMAKNTYGKTEDGFLPWTKAKLDQMKLSSDAMPKLHDESDSIDAEAIASAQPDLILGMESGMTKEQFETLSKIAPTVAYQKVAWGDPWHDVVTTTAQAIGKPEQGKKLINSLEQQIADAVAQYPNLKGKSAAVMYFDASKLSTFSVYTTTDLRPQYLNDMGLDTPQSITELSKKTDKFYQDISSEHADQFNDVDIIVTYGTPDLLAAIQKDPLLGQIPAVKRGSVVVIDSTSEMANALDPTALSIPATVGQYAKMLSEAATKVA